MIKNFNKHHTLQGLLTLVLILTACRPGSGAVIPTETPASLPQVGATPTAIPPSATPTTTPTSVPTDTPLPPTSTPLPIAYGPDNFPVNVNPLTGLEAANPALLERRPIAVKINLVPRTTYRPTWGLSLADIVWEYYHNDGYTRLFAIFYSQDAELAGAIRSGRMPDNDLIQMYKSIFAYGSADILVNYRLLNAAYANRLVLEGQRSNCPPTAKAPLCRFEPAGPDLLLTGTQALSQYITDKKIENGRQNLDGMTFHQTLPAGGAAATQAYIHYSIDSYGRWDYDPATGRYLLFQDNNLAMTTAEETYAPLMDRVNNQQIMADNVVILVAQHSYFQPPPSEIVEIALSGTGKAYALRDGQVYVVTWNRPTNDSVLYLTFPDGSRYPYKPGTTWYQVIGSSSEVTQPQAGIWKFVFRFP